MKVEERAQQAWQILSGAARQRQILTYGMLGERMGMPPIATGAPLHCVMAYCAARDLPPLTVLVVSAETGLPGSGLTTVQDLPEDREAVFTYNWDASLPPSANDFAAHKRASEKASHLPGGQKDQPASAAMPIAVLWACEDERLWFRALLRYKDFLKPSHIQLEEELERLDLSALNDLDVQGWYDFLYDRYFRWKFTAANRLATTRSSLAWYKKNDQLDQLLEVKNRLLSFDLEDIAEGLRIAFSIRGLGPSGASGLLALMHPTNFATIDQFVVKALREVPDLEELEALQGMNPVGLTEKDGVVLISIMRRKAVQNNEVFGSTFWTPRRIDKVLWTTGHDAQE